VRITDVVLVPGDDALGYPYAEGVITWNKNYVGYPHWPTQAHTGRVLSGHCVLSRHPLRENRRYPLPRTSAGAFWFHLYNFERSIQHVMVDLGHKHVGLFNVHFEKMFASNREHSARYLVDLVRSRRLRDYIVAGDFNSIVPEASQQTGFIDEPESDFSAERSLAIVRELGVAEVAPVTGDLVSERRWFTFPANAPTRRLDHLFHSAGLGLRAAEVPAIAGPSDHRPLIATLELLATAATSVPRRREPRAELVAAVDVHHAAPRYAGAAGVGAPEGAGAVAVVDTRLVAEAG
jgi:endonuclease/exonuclease/phosphatase family metal-dependent hydrolase